MEAKEKAKELVGNYFTNAWQNSKTTDADEAFDISVQCAIIAVETILEDLDDYHDSHYHDERLSYWSSVIEEIEKL